jgi:5-formyltetrahydrofolate cyclo-ligase
MLSEKKRLRSHYLARRSQFVRTCNKQKVSSSLSEHALAWDALGHISNSAFIAGYWPTDEEMDVKPLLHTLHQKGNVLCLPCIVGHYLIFRQWTLYTPLIPGYLGTYEPSPEAEILLPQIILVPLVAFNRQGARLGQGKGYYDRTLSALKHSHDIKTLGIAYACQEASDDLQQEPHDIPLHAIATEEELIFCCV